MLSVFWLAAYNPLLTRAQLTQQAMQVTAELLFSYFKIHLQLREGHALLHMVWDFVWELSFSVTSFLKKCEATVAKKKKKRSETLERKERG